MNDWTEPQEFTLKQHDRLLPPTWISKANERQTNAGTIANTRGIYRSSNDRTLAQRICTLLKNAQEVVIVSSFLLADAAVEACLLETAERGVRVYLLIAAEARLEREPREDAEFEQRVLAEHKAMLNRLAGWVLIRSAASFHAKVVLVDPEEGHGILLTANLTTEALERNEEIGVELTVEESRAAWETLRWAMWEGAEHEMLEPKRLGGVKPLGQIPTPTPHGGIFATVAQTTSLATETRRMIDSAKSELLISSFGWDAEHPVVRRLCERVREGLRVVVLARVRPKAMPTLVMLAEAGARVVGFPWLHAKALWSDQDEGLVMSANFEPHGLTQGFEMGVALRSERATALEKLLRHWAGTAPWELLAKPTLALVEGKAKVWHQKKLADIEVRRQEEINLGEREASSADNLTTNRPSVPETNGLPQQLAHELLCRWTTKAPLLNPKAKQVLRPTGGKKSPGVPYVPPVFREPNGRLVVAVKSRDELAQAAVVAAEVKAQAIVVAKE